MADQQNDDDRTLEASARKLEQARSRGDVPISREGSAAGAYVAAAIGMLLLAGPTARRIGELMLPLLQQPEAFIDFTENGYEQAGRAVILSLALALLPFFGLALVGSLLPHVVQNSIVFASERLAPKFSNLSPRKAISRIFGMRALFEFAKSMLKMAAVGFACFVVVRPLFGQSIELMALDLHALPPIFTRAIFSILAAATVVAFVIAGIDVPYQHWDYRRRQRMSMQEMKEEMRQTEGDPHIKARLRRLRRERAQRRMLRDVRKASVVITNPTHYAVALRYARGTDVAPVVVAKGADLLAQKIREIAYRHNVPVVPDPPLARALYAAVEIGDVIPKQHFEAVAKIIGLVWAQKVRAPGAGSRLGAAD